MKLYLITEWRENESNDSFVSASSPDEAIALFLRNKAEIGNLNTNSQDRLLVFAVPSPLGSAGVHEWPEMEENKTVSEACIKLEMI